MRLDIGRQKELEPHRMEYAKRCIRYLGIEITKDISIENKTFFEFNWKGSTVRVYPYSGWHTGKTIKDGRGLDNLLRQLKIK